MQEHVDYINIAKQVFSSKTYKRIIILIVFVILVLSTYMFITNVRIENILKANKSLLLIAITLTALVNFIDTLRLMVLASSVGYRMRFIDALRARLMGNIIALATPSSIGGEPARALILSSYGINIVKAAIITLFEDYWDIVIANLPALILALTRLPLSIIIVLASLYNIMVWNILFFAPRVKKIRLLLEKLYRYSKGITHTIVGIVIHAIKFVNTVIDSAKLRKIFIPVLALTIIKYVVMVLAFFFAALSIESVSLTQSFEALLFYSAMGVIPTPGASGGLEYGLSLVLKPVQVVIIRIIVFTTTLIIGLPLLISYLRRRSIESFTNINISTSST